MMMTTFFEGLGGKLAERYVAALVTPAALFWAGGLGAWIFKAGWEDSGKRLVDWFGPLSGTEQGLLVAGGLLALVGLAAVANALVPTTLRLLEGYWPWGTRWLAERFARWRSRVLATGEKRRRDLEEKRRNGGLNVAESLEFVRLDVKLRRAPAVAAERRATRLGNTLRAAELWPKDKYGLSTAIVWPRLWLVLPDTTRAEISSARQQLDQAVVIWIWGLLLAIWAVLTWWAFAAAAVVVGYAYWRAVSVAAVYGDLVEAAFDLYRADLYRQLRLAKPRTTTEEATLGAEVTFHLWRGLGTFTFSEDNDGD